MDVLPFSGGNNRPEQSKLDLSKTFMKSPISPFAAVLLLSLVFPASAKLSAQAASPFQGSVTRGEASTQPISLSLDDAIQRGLTTNLGVILSGTQTAQARGQRLSQLQNLLPSIDATAREADMQVDLPAQGLRLPGFPTIIGPFGFTDVRASLSWSLFDLPSLCVTTLPRAITLPPRSFQQPMRETWLYSRLATHICSLLPISPESSAFRLR